MNLVGPNGLLLFPSPAVQSALPLAGWQSWYVWLVGRSRFADSNFLCSWK